jgi:1-acyl-sn-glycerol-3-phosphate acyltransferase
MSVPQTITAALIGWVAVVLAVRWVVIPLLRRGPGGEPILALMWLGCRLYARLVHRVRHVGHDDLRRTINPGGLVIVSNHTSSIDPLLIQTGCWFPIRWLMAAEMMSRNLDWIWEQQRVIPVSRDRADSRPLREAIRHVQAGGVVGIFPEGRLVSPRGEIRPFHNGIGAIVSKTGAPALLVSITGTPMTEQMAKAFSTPSRARVMFLDVMRFKEGTDAKHITNAIRERLARMTGWQLNDEPMPRDT